MGETIKERTIAFVKSKGITMKKFEQACGLSSGYVTLNTAEKIANALGKKITLE